MNKSPYVLRALGLLGFEDMLKLSEVLNTKQVPLKKAAGSDLVVWDEETEKRPKKKTVDPPPEAKVLAFPKTVNPVGNLLEERKPETSATEETETVETMDEYKGEKIVPSELLLWQREITKDAGDAIQKIEAKKGYQASSRMYIIKGQTADGKEKIRFASTNGILVNKKQA